MNERSTRSVDPILTLQVPSPVASLCFVAKETSISNDQDDSSTSSSSDRELELRGSSLQRLNQAPDSSHSSTPSSFAALSNRLLASCHVSGESYLWDLGRQKIILADIASNRTGPGLAIRRTADDRFLFHTRDPDGIVSVHSVDREDCPIVAQFETFSQTFCQAAPCTGDPNLLAVPCRQDKHAMVVDIRDRIPVTEIPIQSHGMLTSLAMSTCSGTGRPILACGMESGSIFFHDFTSTHQSFKVESKLSKDPILAMDLAIAGMSTSYETSSVVAIAGMAGDAAEEQELPESQQGRVALLKASYDPTMPNWNVRVRARISTCSINDDALDGKPGISICRFQPGDARLWAVGGWDHRVRLFERSTGKPMAILRGHTTSVNALDWAPDANRSGLLASSGGGDSIYVWQCFPK
jgi:WD40 repeat protein